MGCNCGKRRLDNGTSVNQTTASQNVTATAAASKTQVTEPSRRERLEARRAALVAAIQNQDTEANDTQ